MSERIEGRVRVTFRPGTMTPDDWHTRVTVGDRDYVAISKCRACRSGWTDHPSYDEMGQ